MNQALFQQQTAFSIPSSIILGSPKPFLRQGQRSESIRSIAIIARGTSSIRPVDHDLGRYRRHGHGAVGFQTILLRWKSVSSIPERASKHSPTSELTPLSKAEIVKILSKDMDSMEGNSLLRQLQRQRVSGTLDEGVTAPAFLSARALAWLRKNHPMDEDAAINARLDRELEEGNGIDVVYKPQQDPEITDNYSRSVLDQIKELNKAKAAEAQEAKEKEQAGKNAGGPTTLRTAPRAIVARRTESAEWVQKYKEKATSTLKEPPKMTKFQRLWPSTLVTLAVIGLSALFAQNYIPPSRKARLWPEVPPAAATILTLISINFAVFLLWRLPPLWGFLNRYFTVIPAFPYSSSMVACFFSHQSFAHLAGNMLGLWLIGTSLHNDIGRGNFLAVFFTCGVVSSYTSLSSYVLRNILTTCSLGASGAICGLAATYLLLDPQKPLHLMFVPDSFLQGESRYAFLGVLIALDIYGFSRRFRTSIGGRGNVNVDHLAHLGGYATGIGCAQALRYQRRNRKHGEEKKEKRMSPTMNQLKVV